MKLFITVVLLFTAFSFASFAQGMAYEKRIHSSETGTMPYRLLFPENYQRNKKYPVILFLHGAGERGDDNEKQLVHGASLFLLEENRKKFPCFVIIPQCPQDAYWASVQIDRNKTPLTIDFNYTREPTPALLMATEILNRIQKEESVDDNRIYIIGLSMGGMGTFEAVFRNPSRFAAAIPICGGGDSLRYDNRVNKTAFWVFHGAKDAVVDVTYSRQMVQRLQQLKANVKYTEYPEVNHNSWDNAFAEPDLLRWLFLQKRKK